MKINVQNEFLKLIGERHKIVRMALGHYDQGKYDMFFTGKNKNSSRISRIENGHNILFSKHSTLAYKLKIPLLCLYDFNNIFEIKQYTVKRTLEETIKNDAFVFGSQLNSMRRNRRMSILDLEVSSGINSANISNYENAQEDFKINTLNRLVQGLEAQHWELFFDPKNPPRLKSYKIEILTFN